MCIPVLLGVGVEPHVSGSKCCLELGVVLPADHPASVDRPVRGSRQAADGATGVSGSERVDVDKTDRPVELLCRRSVTGEVLVRSTVVEGVAGQLGSRATPSHGQLGQCRMLLVTEAQYEDLQPGDLFRFDYPHHGEGPLPPHLAQAATGIRTP